MSNPSSTTPPLYNHRGAPKAYPDTSEFGMDLRDWFAGQAIRTASRRVDPRTATDIAAAIADGAYEIADAMMERRNR